MQKQLHVEGSPSHKMPDAMDKPFKLMHHFTEEQVLDLIAKVESLV